MRTDCPGRGLPVMRIVQFFGTDPSLTEFRGVICRPKDHADVVQAVAAHFLRHRDEWDVFRWNGLRDAPPAYNAPAGQSGFIVRAQLPDYIIELPRRWDELYAHVSSNMRKNLRKAYEFLDRDGFAFSLRVVERPVDVAAAVERFMILHAARSNATNMVHHPNKFSKPHARAFLFEHLHKMAENGQLRIFELEIDGTTVASRLAFVFESDLYLYFSGYSTAWTQYGVMTILVAEIIKWAIAGGLRRVNLSTGKDQSKLRWKPVEVVLHDAVQVAPTGRARLAFRAFRAYEELAEMRVRFNR
jgi:CelD/BcsL family acetyltransferase involved in cellulose biosynthesis